MTSFSTETVTTLIKLRQELSDTLKCHYCENVLNSARTLNCPHHVCEPCALQQLTDEGECTLCRCGYYKKEITNNICINNIVTTFHDLALTIEKAAKLMDIKTDGKYEITPSKPNQDEDISSESDQHEENEEVSSTNNSRKRKRNESDHVSSDEEIEGAPKTKKRKLSPENESTDDAVTVTEEPEEEFWIPSQICITGYDKEITAKFGEYMQSLGLELSKKWNVDSTDILISKYDIINSKPNITFKVLASILCDIPVVKESFIEDSFEANKVLNFNKYVCNYRKVDQSKYGLFEGFNVLFATTNMPTTKLRTLLQLGKAKIIETKEEIHDKDESKCNERVMICAHETEAYRARELSKEYNCRVISESWVIKCIYPDHQINNGNMCLTKSSANFVNYYEMEQITERLDLDEFDQTLKRWDDSESDDEC